MFFLLSKIAGFLIAPSNVLFLAGAVGLLILVTSWRVFGMALVLGSIVGLGLAGLSPLGNWLLRPLEERFPARPETAAAPDGIIVLGGSVSVSVSADRGQPSLNESAERLFVLMELAQRYPEARLVFTGGYGGLGASTGSEAGVTRAFLESVGFDVDRVAFEDRSRNTVENAEFTRALVEPKPGETWLLVTSAYHMPRAVGCFRQAGFAVAAHPVDYRTEGGTAFETFGTVADGLKRTDLAMREWYGLVAYYMTGRTDAPFPAPDGRS